jgi:EmrB/QacA subfamily drug resistance transporter
MRGRVSLPELSRKRRLIVLGICCTSIFLIGLDSTVVNVALPSIGWSMHAPVSGLQWIVDAYTLALASLLMFSGANADRFGRRRIFQMGLGTFVISSLLCSLAPSLGWLLCFRVLQAVGGSMLNPSAMSIIASTFTDGAERARAIGMWHAVFGVSMACGPVLGGLMVGTVGWRGIFWINVPIGLAAIALAALLVPESRAARVRRPDPVGQALVIVMLGALTYAIIEGPYAGWYSARIFGFFSLAVAALAVLLAYEPRRRDPMIELQFFRSVQFSGAAIAGVCAFASLGGFLFLSTLYLQDVRGFSPLSAGLRIAPMAATLAICAPLAGRLVAKGRTRIAMLIAGAALTLSCAELSKVTGAFPARYLFLAYAAFGVGLGMVNEPITYAAVSGMPKDQSGLAGGINSASRMVGLVLGVALTGSVLMAHMHASMQSGFIAASRPAWWVLVGTGYGVLLVGALATSNWAKATAKRTAMRIDAAGAVTADALRDPVVDVDVPQDLATRVWHRMRMAASDHSSATPYGSVHRLPTEDLATLDRILRTLLEMRDHRQGNGVPR